MIPPNNFNQGNFNFMSNPSGCNNEDQGSFKEVNYPGEQTFSNIGDTNTLMLSQTNMLSNDHENTNAHTTNANVGKSNSVVFGELLE